MTKFDLDKAMADGGRCCTRDGRLARIVCTDAKGDRPIVALIEAMEGTEYTFRVGSDGRNDRSREYASDLLNIPERHEMWVNCYPGLSSYGYPTRAQADAHAAPYRIACVRVVYTEGEGLDDA